MTLLTALLLISAQPAMAFDDYVDGVTTLEEILDYTLQHHVDQPTLDQLVNGAIEGMLMTLEDPYTEYLTPESLRNFSDSLNGDYVGIGIRMLAVDGYAKVVEVFENSPAAKAGLQPGDVIIATEGEAIQGESLGKVSEKILGPEGTQVTITLRRGEQEFDVTLTRAAVQISTVHTEVLDGNLGYIEVSSFGEDTATEFASALEQLKTADVSGLVIDLRDNHGGYLMAAQRMASQFVPLGKKVVGIVDRQQQEKLFPSFGLTKAPKVPVVILVNYDSASAAEIFAGSLQDYHLAKLVGVQTYGKGTVQSVINLESGGALKVTTAKYTLPGGRIIDGIGLVPDVQVVCPSLQRFAAQQILQPTEQITIAYQEGEDLATINGEEFVVFGTPYHKAGISYVPLRFTMEALGYHVGWDEERNGIYLKQGSKELFISAVGGTIHPVEIEDGVAYISTADLVQLGIQSKVEKKTVIISKY